MSLRKRTSGDVDASKDESTPESQKGSSQIIASRADHVVTAEATARKYHSLFPEISSISSRELIQETFDPSNQNSHWKYHGRNALLVDVRTSQERRVSMIAGAVSMEHFKKDILPSILEEKEKNLANKKSSDEYSKSYIDQSSQTHSYTKIEVNEDKTGGDKNDTIPTTCLRPEMIIMYCTVGYRSGMEARKLKQEYPSLFYDDKINQHDETNDTKAKLTIGNLDGIVNFANSNMDAPGGNNAVQEKSSAISSSRSLLLDPQQQPTMRVHVYGTPWKNCVSSEIHQVVIFSKLDFLLKSTRIVLRNVILSCKNCWK